MEATGPLVTYVVKNKELLIHTSDFVSFLLVTPEISKFTSGSLAKKWKYVGATFLLAIFCVAIASSAYSVFRGEKTLALIFVGIVIFYAITLPGTLRQLWTVFDEQSVPILQPLLRKAMFTLGFLLFGLSRAIGILASVIETH